MDPGRRSLFWYLLAGTRGGPNRLRILEMLERAPGNAHQVAQALGLDYRTARHHLQLLERNGLVLRPIGRAYASPYELAPRMAADYEEVRAMVERARESPRAARLFARGEVPDPAP